MRQIYLYNFRTKQEFDESSSVVLPYAAYVAEKDRVYYPHTKDFEVVYNGVDTIEFIGDTEYSNDTLNLVGADTSYADGNLIFN